MARTPGLGFEGRPVRYGTGQENRRDDLRVKSVSQFSPAARQSAIASGQFDPLILRVAERDTVAFESLYDSHHRLVFGIALRLLGDAPSAEDLTQAVFLKVWVNAASFKGGSLAAWIARVTRNAGLDVLRSRSTHHEDSIAADVPVDTAVEDAVVASINAEEVRSALAQLPDTERSPIEMGFFGGMTYSRIAVETGVPLGTVKTRIRSGLHRLRDTLADETTARRERARRHRTAPPPPS